MFIGELRCMHRNTFGLLSFSPYLLCFCSLVFFFLFFWSHNAALSPFPPTILHIHVFILCLVVDKYTFDIVWQWEWYSINIYCKKLSTNSITISINYLFEFELFIFHWKMYSIYCRKGQIHAIHIHIPYTYMNEISVQRSLEWGDSNVMLQWTYAHTYILTIMYWKCTEAMNVMMYGDNFLFGPQLNHLKGWTHRHKAHSTTKTIVIRSENICNYKLKCFAAIVVAVVVVVVVVLRCTL